MNQLPNAQHEQIEKLGGPLGSPDDDWFRAEQELIQPSDWSSRLPFSSLMMEPVEH